MNVPRQAVGRGFYRRYGIHNLTFFAVRYTVAVTVAIAAVGIIVIGITFAVTSTAVTGTTVVTIVAVRYTVAVVISKYTPVRTGTRVGNIGRSRQQIAFVSGSQSLVIART